MELTPILKNRKRKSMNNKGQIEGAVNATVLIVIAAIIGAFLFFALTVVGIFAAVNLYQIMGFVIILVSLIIGLPIVLRSGNQLAIGLLIVVLLIGGSFIAAPFLSDALGFSIGTTGQFEQTEQQCTQVQDCVDALLQKGIEQSVIDENMDNIKCDEVCYLR